MVDKREGIVTRGHGNRFVVFAEGEYYSCQIRGKVKFTTNQTTPVAVGDDVVITLIDRENAVIEEVKDRRSVLSRPAVSKETVEHVLAANVDSLVVISSTRRPAVKIGLIDRFIIAAQLGGLEPVIVINKMDLGLTAEIETIMPVYRQLGFCVFLTSALPGYQHADNEIEAFGEYIGTHCSILAGHSGVGKSSLLNRLYPDFNLRTASVSETTERGRHATSRMELFHLPGGGFVIDSPGIKVLGLWRIDKEQVVLYYPEMVSVQERCRFTGCSHTHEPGCAVKAAVATGEISEIRYQNYVHILNSLTD